MNVKLVNKGDTALLQFGLLQSDKLFHFTTTIKGGVSHGAYASFNLGNTSGDSPENVIENRKRLSAIADILPDNLFIPYQTHEDKICIIDQNFLVLSDIEKTENLKSIDSLITNQKGVCIGITTADCVPVLLFDPVENILAAAHAGWKGTIAKIAGKTVTEMVKHFGCRTENILAGIGPCISLEKFEVGDEVSDKFADAGFSMKDIGYRNPQTGKMHIDLQLANKMILIEVGIPAHNIETANLCTYSNSELFFSARRQTIYSGRMITGGILK